MTPIEKLTEKAKEVGFNQARQRSADIVLKMINDNPHTKIPAFVFDAFDEILNMEYGD